jgi:hypothetical protein
MLNPISHDTAPPRGSDTEWDANRWAPESVFAGVVTALFLGVGVLGVLHHEMWRDEMHAWLVARDSASLWNVFQVTRYEAHFALWRVILYGLARFTHNPLAMQFLSLLVATGTVWVVTRFSPWQRLEKVLFSFGYFSLYEYCLIAQDYNLIVLLLFSFCALYRRRAESYLGVAIVLALMANTVPYGLAMALIFTALLVFDWIFNKEERRTRMVSRHNLRASALLWLAGFGSAGLQFFRMKPSPSTTWKPMLSFAGFTDTLANVWSAYVPIPAGFPVWRRVGWGTNFLLQGIPNAKEIAVCLALVCVAISVGLLVRRPPALFLYVAGIGVLLCIQFVVSIGALRHTGFLFLLLLASLWIADESAAWELSAGWLRRLGDACRRWRRPVVVGLLVIHLAAGIDLFGMDWFYQFSASKSAADFIRERGLSNLAIVGTEETHVATLSGYLERPIYYPDSSRFGTYIDYSRPINSVSREQLMMEALAFARQTHQGVVLVLSRPIVLVPEDSLGTQFEEMRVCADGALSPLSFPGISPSGRITRLTHFPGIVDEKYFIYLLREE